MTRERSRTLAAVRTALLALAAGLAALPARAQSLSPEFRIAGSGVSADLFTARDTRVAFDGKHYVVVWNDPRRAPDGLLGGPALLAARVTSSGKLLDPNGVVVATEGFTSGSISTLRRAPWGSSVLDAAGWLLRLDSEVRPIDKQLSVPFATESRAVSCSESDCLGTGVGWFELDEPQGDVSSARRTRGAVLDSCGTLLATSELDMVPGRWISEYGGEVHLLVGIEEETTDTTGLAVPRASAISRDGRLLWGPDIVASTEPNAATYDRFVAAYGRAHFLVVWATRSEERSQLWATTVAPSGPSGDASVVLESGPELELGGIAWEGEQFRLVYASEGEVHSLILDEDAGVIGESVLSPRSGDCVPTEVRVTRGNSNSLVAWSWGGATPCRGDSALIVADDPAEPVTPVAFLRPRASTELAAFASDGQSYLAAWFEPRRDAPGIYVRRLALDGSPYATPPALVIALDPLARPVLWNTFVEGRYRVGADGHFVLVDPETLSVTEESSDSCAGETNVGLELGTERGEGGEDLPTTQRLVAFRVERDACGRAVSSEQTWIHQSPDFSVDQNILSAFDGERYAVIWYHRAGTTPIDSAYFMSFDQDALPLLDAPSALEGVTGLPTALSWNGGSHLLITNERNETGDANGLAARRLSPEGDWLDPEAVQLAELTFGANIGGVLAVPEPEGWLVAWEQSETTSPNIAAARFSSQGAVTWRGIVANSPERERLITAVASGGPSALVAYGRFDPDPDVVANLVLYRVLAAEGCEPLDGCAADACDACCANGCLAPVAAAACEPPSCASGCGAGERCVEGLGCLAEPAAPEPRTSRGCGCRQAPASTGSLLSPLWLAAGVTIRRRQRGPRSARLH